MTVENGKILISFLLHSHSADGDSVLVLYATAQRCVICINFGFFLLQFCEFDFVELCLFVLVEPDHVGLRVALLEEGVVAVIGVLVGNLMRGEVLRGRQTSLIFWVSLCRWIVSSLGSCFSVLLFIR